VFIVILSLDSKDETLFFSISFLAEKDLIISSTVDTFFSKSKSFPEMNKDSPKAYT